MHWMIALHKARSEQGNYRVIANLLYRCRCTNSWTIGLHGGLRHGRAPRGHHRLRRSCRSLHRSPGWLALQRLLGRLFCGPHKPRRWRLPGWQQDKGLRHRGHSRLSLHTCPCMLQNAMFSCM